MKSKQIFRKINRSWLPYLAALTFLFLFSGRVVAQAYSGQKKEITIAILPPLVSLDRHLWGAGVDSVALKEIRKNEAFNNQRNSFYLLTVKNPPVKGVIFKPIGETNARLEAAGLTYEKLLQARQEEVAGLLGVDMVFTGVRYRKPHPVSQEVRLVRNLAASALLPLNGFYAQSKGNPVTSFHYTLYSSSTQAVVWQYRGQHEIVRNNAFNENVRLNTYITNFRDFLKKTYASRLP